MSNDGLMFLTITGATPAELFQRFGEVAQRFGYVLGPAAEAVREAEFNLPEAVTIGEVSQCSKTEHLRGQEAPTAAALEVKKRRVRRTRAQLEADNAAAVNSQPEHLRGREAERLLNDPDPAPFVEPVETAENFAEHDPPLTIADVKLAGGRLLQANNGDPAPLRALLDHYGVVRMTPLPEEHWAEFISKCDQWRP